MHNTTRPVFLSIDRPRLTVTIYINGFYRYHEIPKRMSEIDIKSFFKHPWTKYVLMSCNLYWFNGIWSFPLIGLTYSSKGEFNEEKTI